MAISQELLAILVDPLTKDPLELVHDEKMGERLHCPQNGLYYRIDEPDIPVLLLDEAQLEDGSSAHEKVQALKAQLEKSEASL